MDNHSHHHDHDHSHEPFDSPGDFALARVGSRRSRFFSAGVYRGGWWSGGYGEDGACSRVVRSSA